MPTPSLSSPVAIRLENISVSYRTPNENYSTLKEYAIRFLQGRVEHNVFWALRDVSMNVHQGEVFGLIGRNGAGKSTLLKVVARVLRPTGGRVVVTGLVAPLLEIGAGFHFDLTGRENVYLNASLLGYSRQEINRSIDDMIEFAELQEFIDVPLRTYSSGMVARLGFAVATHIRPDVLIVDEILGVGDEVFQNKCVARIMGYSQQGTTIFLVSHSSALIQTTCTRAAWLSHGRLVAVGEPAEIVSQYHQNLDARVSLPE
jgi:ABC-type polysaccharide/polyol phosphate transport system ATPase subunit